MNMLYPVYLFALALAIGVFLYSSSIALAFITFLIPALIVSLIIFAVEYYHVRRHF